RCYLKKSEYSSAITTMKELLNLYPQTDYAADICYNIGVSYYQLKEYQKAILEFDKLTQNFSQKDDLIAEALYLKGKSLQNINQTTEALKTYQRLISNYPQTSSACKAYLERGNHFIAEKDYLRAEEEYLKIANYDLTKEIAAEAQFYIGKCAFLSKNINKALVEYLKVAYFYPEITNWAAKGQFQAALTYEEMNNLPQAKKLYQSIIATYKDSQEAEKSKACLDILEKKATKLP
ncbi:tetratricopeptide repeat protein, partial [bacterium]|nr:tetratricopeptide repeat protein [bacterium]